MPKNPLVSVVIVTYQQADFIRECIDSVVAQKTDFPIEIIIGEDDSTDGTREICQEYAATYPDLIRLFLRSRNDVIYVNGLPIGTFNFTQSLLAAKGKYIALLEGDDYWLDPLKLQKQVAVLENSKDCILCHHWQRYAVKEHETYKIIDREDHGYLPAPVSSVEKVFSNELRIKTRTLMFRNVITPDFFPKWYFTTPFGDVALSFILGRYGRFCFINEAMAVYRITDSGSSSDGRKTLGPGKFAQMHLREWIRVWDFGFRYHDYNYKEQYLKTTSAFVKQLAITSISSFQDVVQSLRFILTREEIPAKYKIQQSMQALLAILYTLMGRKNNYTKS